MSFDSCVSDDVKRFLATVRNNDLSQAQKVPNNDNMLWELRNKIPRMKLEDDEDRGTDISLTEVDWSSLGIENDCSRTEYQHQISSMCQDLLVREMSAMKINKNVESEEEKDMSAPMSDQIWKFVLLLSAKLEENEFQCYLKKRKYPLRPIFL